MNRNKQLFQFLKEFVVFAGGLARPYYGTISSTNKITIENGKNRESAVTIIDHAIQELLLAGLLRNGFTHLAFNGEEDTHLKFFFSNDYQRDVTLHCDPIDGTVSFSSGKNRFAVGMGLSEFTKPHHAFFATTIYSPLEKILYHAYRDEVSRHSVNKNPPKTICYAGCFSKEGRRKIEDLGYQFVFPGSLHLGIVETALGKMGCQVWWNITVHDALIPYAFGQQYGSYPHDIEGNALKRFPLVVENGQFARIPKLCWFANEEMKEELLPIIQDPKNVNEK